MRRKIFYQDAHHVAVERFARANTFSLAALGPGQCPIVRTMHGVVVDDLLAMHCAPAGEKWLARGQTVTANVEQVIASLPSTFTDPHRACPATTLYRSAQASGELAQVEDTQLKARMLQALMEKYQPEGGYRPLVPLDSRDRKAVEGVGVLVLSLERAIAKSKLAQNINDARRADLLQKLWDRGDVGDAAAIEAIIEANPTTALPAFLLIPKAPSLRLISAVPRRLLEQAVALVEHEYWQVDGDRAVIAKAHLGSAVWVGVVDEQGELVATARANTDGARNASIYDVAVARSWRGRGVGQAMFDLLVSHPLMRDVSRLWLRTRDAQSFYRRFGFVEHPSPACASTEMVRIKAA